MKIIEMLKNRNRTLLELHIGIVFWTVVASVVGAVLPLHKLGIGKAAYLVALFAAMAAAMLSTLHMQHSLERAFGMDEGTATKLITKGYLIRYGIFVVAVVVSAIAGFPDPVVLCLGYILLVKAGAYSQPFTHKLCNKVFHETDPIPEPVSDEEWDREKQKGER